LAQQIMNESPLHKNLSIFMAHGRMDPIVTFQTGESSLACLQKAGYEPEWHTYPMDHTVCLPELHDLGTWIKNRLA